MKRKKRKICKVLEKHVERCCFNHTKGTTARIPAKVSRVVVLYTKALEGT